jgi:hypothetical protein
MLFIIFDGLAKIFLKRKGNLAEVQTLLGMRVNVNVQDKGR